MEQRRSRREQALALVELGNALLDAGLAEEASELLSVAAHLDDSAEVRASLGRARQLQRTREPDRNGRGVRRDALVEAAAERLRRQAVDAVQFTGLARQLWRKGDDAGAAELLAIARDQAPALPEVHRLLAALAAEMGRFGDAAIELSEALKLDPFDGEAADQLTYAEERRFRLEDALDAALHAFLLLADLDAAKKGELRQRIATLARRLRLSRDELRERLTQRREAIETATDRLRFRQQELYEEGIRRPHRAFFGPGVASPPAGSLELATALSRFSVLADLGDDDLFRLSGAVQAEVHPEGSLLRERHEGGHDFFLVGRGEVHLVRPGPIDSLVLRRLSAGDIFGEESFLEVSPTSGDALTARPTHLYRFDSAALKTLLATSPALESRLLWVLWHTLAAKLRRANEELRSIFGPSASDPIAAGPGRAAALGERLENDREATLTALSERGLSRQELALVAHFSEEKRFASGEYLFREGDAGTEIFAVVAGKIVISKFIPGGGEEALSVLGPGELFGEMALLDGQPRSADARVEVGPATVLVLDGPQLRALFASGSPESAEALRLLARLLARRLIELDEKLVLWKILTATSPDYHRQAG